MKISSSEPEKLYSFDISKANQIFDYLMATMVIKLLDDHIMPMTEDMKKKTYCKWHGIRLSIA